MPTIRQWNPDIPQPFRCNKIGLEQILKMCNSEPYPIPKSNIVKIIQLFLTQGFTIEFPDQYKEDIERFFKHSFHYKE